MNFHQLIDERSLELHAVIARELRADPAKLEVVVAWIQRFLDDPDYSESGKDALSEWLEIIREGLPRVLEVLADRSDEGQRLRQSTPFAAIMPQDERARIFARYESRRDGARTAQTRSITTRNKSATRSDKPLNESRRPVSEIRAVER